VYVECTGYGGVTVRVSYGSLRIESGVLKWREESWRNFGEDMEGVIWREDNLANDTNTGLSHRLAGNRRTVYM
jgi:hypothetical protein